MLLWGPPGCGKTTLARLLAKEFSMELINLNAVSDGVKDLRNVFEASEGTLRPILLFVDEIHRFKSSQQDALLGAVEAGQVTFVGATTENPSFYLNRALLSRLRVVQLQPLLEEDFVEIIDRALSDRKRGLGNSSLAMSDGAKKIVFCKRRRRASSFKHTRTSSPSRLAKGERILNVEDVEEAAQFTSSHYDRSGEQHYDFISALHKSIRNSNPDAALYYMARMVEGGEDPLL